MTRTALEMFRFDNSFVRDLPGLYQWWNAESVADPTPVVVNTALATELGLDLEVLSSPDGIQALLADPAPAGAEPVALAYAGHQFGSYSPRLGDGRALLLGEMITPDGQRLDVHLKGSGRTPFARGGDGRAVLGPMLREYLMGEAMHALGVPTTRALAVIATGEDVRRETSLPGAVLVRVASSHIRVGTFQFAAATGDLDLLRALATHTIARHYPSVASSSTPTLALFEQVLAVQADLVARWMTWGFIHGVLNTDNVTVSGETIDYGPCAFMDRYDQATVFSSIDHGGRYAFGNQPGITQWNLARFAETLLALMAADAGVDPEAMVEPASEVLGTFSDVFSERWHAHMLHRVGLDDSADARTLVADLVAMAQAHQLDLTMAVRALVDVADGDTRAWEYATAGADDAEQWVHRWRLLARVDAATMRGRTPVSIPRNHEVERVLAAATDGDIAPFMQVLDALTSPFAEAAGAEALATPGPDAPGYRTFCGT